MKFDFQLIYLFIALGIAFKRLSWKGWMGVAMLVFLWIMWNWKRPL